MSNLIHLEANEKALVLAEVDGSAFPLGVFDTAQDGENYYHFVVGSIENMEHPYSAVTLTHVPYFVSAQAAIEFDGNTNGGNK